MIQMIQQLAVRGDAQAGGELELLLELADSTMTYRGRYQAAPQLPAVLDLLLCDETNPRSAIYQIATLDEHIGRLPSGADERHSDGGPTPRDATQERAQARRPGRAGYGVVRFDTRIDLDRLLRRIERDVHELSDHIAQRFFSHSSATRVGGAGGSRV